MAVLETATSFVARLGYRPRGGQICEEGENERTASVFHGEWEDPFEKGPPRGRRGRFDPTVTRAVPSGPVVGIVEEREQAGGTATAEGRGRMGTLPGAQEAASSKDL